MNDVVDSFVSMMKVEGAAMVARRSYLNLMGGNKKRKRASFLINFTVGVLATQIV
jgi:hypothetical protein